MASNLKFRSDHYHALPFAALQLLACSYCELVKWEFDNLAAPFWRWYHNTSDGAFITVDKKRIPLTPRHIVIIPPHVAFSTKASRLTRHLYFHFTLNVSLTASARQVFIHDVTAAERAVIKRLARLAVSGGQSASPPLAFTAQTLANLALAQIPAADWTSGPADARVERAIRALRESPSLTVSNEDLARAAGMNTGAFIRLFRQDTGYPPRQYHLRLRVEKACWLLRATADSLDTIAAATGFYDRFYFSKMFKLQMNTTPAAYRGKNQERVIGAA